MALEGGVTVHLSRPSVSGAGGAYSLEPEVREVWG